jgi:hypothetical protein
MAEHEPENNWQGHFKQDFDSLVLHANDGQFNSEFDKLPQGEQIAMAKKLETYKAAHPDTMHDVAIIGSDTANPVVWRTQPAKIDTNQMAETIEGHAKGAVTKDAQAQLDLRKDGEQLSHMDDDTRQKVISKLESDGSYWHPFNGVPHAAAVKDQSGQTTSINFSTIGGVNTDAMPLNKTVDQQKEEASAAYETAIHDGRLAGLAPDLAQKVMERDAAKDQGEKPPTIGKPQWWQLDDN